MADNNGYNWRKVQKALAKVAGCNLADIDEAGSNYRDKFLFLSPADTGMRVVCIGGSPVGAIGGENGKRTYYALSEAGHNPDIERLLRSASVINVVDYV